MIAASRHLLWSPAEWCISRISCCADSLSPPIVSTANGRCTARMASAASLYLSTLPRAASFASLAGPVAAVARLESARVSVYLVTEAKSKSAEPDLVACREICLNG